MKAYWYKGDCLNVGDLLTPYILQKITGEQPEWSDQPGKLLCIGSVAEFIQDGDTVWGSGLIQEMILDKKTNVNILAVRGKNTAMALAAEGFDVPEVYGDPAVLMPEFYFPKVKKKYAIGYIPHYIEEKEFKSKYKGHFVSVRNQVEPFITELLACKQIITSSLHAYILAEAYGIKATYLQLTNKIIGGTFKHDDYKSADNDKAKLLEVFTNWLKK